MVSFIEFMLVKMVVISYACLMGVEVTNEGRIYSEFF
jgi:hypothetical protein